MVTLSPCLDMCSKEKTYWWTRGTWVGTTWTTTFKLVTTDPTTVVINPPVEISNSLPLFYRVMIKI
eukprot:snap_masked-scaffold_2-processed-gene-8.27-mRNA-1 protein AED:1.00 eAED:1.00 QI:0/0/0/0/1/1/2/0/65